MRWSLLLVLPLAGGFAPSAPRGRAVAPRGASVREPATAAAAPAAEWPLGAGAPPRDVRDANHRIAYLGRRGRAPEALALLRALEAHGAARGLAPNIVTYNNCLLYTSPSPRD